MSRIPNPDFPRKSGLEPKSLGPPSEPTCLWLCCPTQNTSWKIHSLLFPSSVDETLFTSFTGSGDVKLDSSVTSHRRGLWTQGPSPWLSGTPNPSPSRFCQSEEYIRLKKRNVEEGEMSSGQRVLHVGMWVDTTVLLHRGWRRSGLSWIYSAESIRRNW